MTRDYYIYLGVWLGIFALVIVAAWRRQKVGGLVLAYLLNLWLIHWVGPSLYLIPDYSYYDSTAVSDGLKESLIAVIAFAVGCLLIAPALMRIFSFPPCNLRKPKPETKLPNVYIAIGFGCFFILHAVLRDVPTLTAILATGWNLAVIGLILKCWHAWNMGNAKRFYGWVSLTVLLPFITIITQGFIASGILALTVVVSFVFCIYRPRWKLVLASILIAYMALSLYVTYMRDRSLIRESVWGGQTYSQRLDTITTTLAHFEFFDPANEEHLHRVDERLNQTALVGYAVSYIGGGGRDFAKGDTFVDAFLALIPRAVWKDKPMKAGSGDLVSQYTGFYFNPETSVGVGHVLEFYVNFGSYSVIVGFLLIGVILAFLDRGASVRLVENDWQGFAFWFLPGIAFLHVEGSLIELTASAGASLVLATAVKRYVLPTLQKRSGFVKTRAAPQVFVGPITHNR